jgi:hypothetical protein
MDATNLSKPAAGALCIGDGGKNTAPMSYRSARPAPPCALSMDATNPSKASVGVPCMIADGIGMELWNCRPSRHPKKYSNANYKDGNAIYNLAAITVKVPAELKSLRSGTNATETKSAPRTVPDGDLTDWILDIALEKTHGTVSGAD